MTRDQWKLLAETVKAHGLNASATALFLARFHAYLSGIGFGLRRFLTAHPVDVIPLPRIPSALTITGQRDVTGKPNVWGVYHHNGGVRPTILLDVVTPGPRLEEVLLHECLHHVDFSGERTYLLAAHARLLSEGKVPEDLKEEPHEYFAQMATTYVREERRIDECHAQIVQTVFRAAGLGLAAW